MGSGNKLLGAEERERSKANAWERSGGTGARRGREGARERAPRTAPPSVSNPKKRDMLENRPH